MSIELRVAAAALGVALSATVATPAHALPGPFPDVALGVEASTLGLGAQATFKLLPWVNVRATIQGFDYKHGFSSDGIDYDGSLKLLTYGAYIDLYPLTRGPRLTAGLLGNGNKLGVHANCADGCNADAITIQGDDADLDGGVKFGSVAPYVGLGWGNAMAGLPFYASFDIGVVFQGTPKVNLSASGTGTVMEDNGATRTNVNLATDPQVQSEVASQQQTLSDDLSHYRYYPVAALTIGWRF